MISKCTQERAAALSAAVTRDLVLRVVRQQRRRDRALDARAVGLVQSLQAVVCNATEDRYHHVQAVNQVGTITLAFVSSRTALLPNTHAVFLSSSPHRTIFFRY
jgi:hypothetical protein